MLDRRLVYFLAVAREGSFSRAAEVLHVAQPALSRQVALLEAELGTRLLERGPGGAVPTEAGRRLAERGGALEREAAALRDELRAFVDGRRGRVALGYSTSLAYGTAPVLLEGLRRRLPEVDVAPLLRPTPELAAALREGQLDLALARCAAPVDGVAQTVVRRERLGVLVAAGHPLGAGHLVDLRDLADAQIVLHDRADNPGHYDLVVGACRAAGFEPRLAGAGAPFDPAYGPIAEGSAVAIVGEATQAGMPATLVWRQLRDAPRVDITLQTRGGEGSAVVLRAAEAVRDEAVARGWTAAA